MGSRSEGELQAASCSNNELIAMEDLTKAAAFFGRGIQSCNGVVRVEERL